MVRERVANTGPKNPTTPRNCTTLGYSVAFPSIRIPPQLTGGYYLLKGKCYILRRGPSRERGSEVLNKRSLKSEPAVHVFWGTSLLGSCLSELPTTACRRWLCFAKHAPLHDDSQIALFPAGRSRFGGSPPWLPEPASWLGGHSLAEPRCW